MTMSDVTRREFLRRTSALSVLGAASPWALNLAAIGEAAAATGSVSDYKALVCIFLDGGNDNGNTIIPCDATTYAAYAQIRQGMARPLSSLTPLVPRVALSDTRQWAMAPELAPLQPLFASGALGVLMNVGTLVVPTTKAQYTANSVSLPPKLFSHDDQSMYWQASGPEGSLSGWGGRTADMFLSSNGSSAFTCVSASGSALYLSGKTVMPYQVSPSGAVSLAARTTPMFGSQACSNALLALLASPRTNLIESSYSAVVKRALSANDLLSSALQATPTLNTVFPSNNTLAAQLQMVARMIAGRSLLGVKRQVFYVSLGSFDQHAGLSTTHPQLLAQVAAAMSAFYAATVELGVANQVTSFTASDFGRTLSVNGDGSDHGWGGHHLIMGGVKGQRIWGKPPVIAVDGPDDVGQGRLLPSTSVEQLGGELATWFGVASSDMTLALPNASNFSLGQLGLFS